MAQKYYEVFKMKKHRVIRFLLISKKKKNAESNGSPRLELYSF
jgi:hypothetical protein